MVEETWIHVPCHDFLAHQILNIVSKQIEIEIIFSLIGILTNLRRCCLQSKFLEKLMFVNKNWLNDQRVDCKSSFNSINFIEMNVIVVGIVFENHQLTNL